MANPLLIDLAFSSWSEKARWALEWKGVAYERREFVPMIDDGWLRRVSGADEVPVLVREGGRSIAGSTRIALALEADKPEPRLLPADRRLRAEALRWQDWASDVLMPVGRLLITDGLSRDRAAALATVPPNAPGYAKLFAAIAVSIGLRGFRKAYGIDDAAIAAAKEDLPRLLECVAAAIEGASTSTESSGSTGASAAGPRYLVGDAFSLADLALASALVLVAPPANEWLPRPMPDALRRAFTTADAVKNFPGIFAWRDEIYRKHRKRMAPG